MPVVLNSPKRLYLLITPDHALWSIARRRNSISFAPKQFSASASQNKGLSLTVHSGLKNRSPLNTVTLPLQVEEHRQLLKNLPPNSSQTLQGRFNREKYTIACGRSRVRYRKKWVRFRRNDRQYEGY
ncbi:hypothetical protein TNCV_3342041 [Trichonephila clavipes]|nr:hypothetical protein TNCV_3342041 [Trichonephila clavipes]